jgi:hypothetical protein
MSIVQIAASLAALSPQTAPPMLFHYGAPISRVVTTEYECEDGSRSFAVRYRHHIFERVDRAIRHGRALSAAPLERATAALRELDGFETIIPECSRESDSLMVVGRVGRQRVILFLHWTDGDITARPPEPIGE